MTHKERRQGLGTLGPVSEQDEFDIMARSLLFEARAQASDRTKTKEERAADEFENMKEKEEERKKRARGDYDHDEDEGKCSKRRRSNVAVIIVRIIFIGSFLFYCLLLNHSFQTNPNKITNCF